MQIVIDVDTDNPIHHAEGTDYFMPALHAFISENILEILKEKGKVLPKGHGRIIDADEAIKTLKFLGNRDHRKEKGTIQEAEKMLSFDEYTPTIIEADKEEEDEFDNKF